MIIMSHFSRRRNLIGSSQYGISIRLHDLEFKEDMRGEIELFEGKHVIETHKFESFNLLSRVIISFWEKKLGTQVNVHRYANWLSECFEDLGLKKVTFHQILEAARSVGKGASLQSSGYEIRETKVIQMPLGKPYETETRDFPSSSAQKEVMKIEKPIVATKEEKARTLPIQTQKLKKPLEDTLVKPSELFKQQKIPHRDSLLKPSEYLKERETVGSKGESTVQASTTLQKPISSQVKITVEDIISSPTGSKSLIEKQRFDTGQVVTKKEDFEHKPPEDSLIKPSDYIKEHKDTVVQHGRLGRPIKIPQKVDRKPLPQESKPLPQESKPLPQESLIKPSDYIREHKDKVVQEDQLVKPSEYLIEEKEESEDSNSPLKPLRIIKPKSSRIVSDPIPLPMKPYYKKDIKPDIKKKPKEESGAEEFPEEEPIIITSDEPKIAITNIKGVGSRKAMLLRESGYNTVEKIAAISLEKLSEIKGIGPSNAKMIIDSAKKLVE